MMTTKGFEPEVLLLVSVLLAAVPVIVVSGTCYLKFSIVLGLLRSGFGTQQTPGNGLIVGFSAVLSLVVMQSVLTETGDRLQQFDARTLSKMSFRELLDVGDRVARPWKGFLLRHAGERELEFFKVRYEAASEHAQVFGPWDPSLPTALGAFVLTEVKKAFVMGFMLLVPFFVIDMVIANVLVGLGLTMMSPITVALPLKVLVFVTTDGWLSLANGLTRGYL